MAMRFAALLMLFLIAPDAEALQNQVTVADGNVEHLRAAIERANASGKPTRILLRTKGTYVITEDLPPISSDVKLEGSGATITSSPGYSPRLFTVLEEGSLRVSNLTIEDFEADGGPVRAFFQNYGNLVLDRVAILNNDLRSRYNHNFVYAIFNHLNAKAVLRNVTLVNNSYSGFVGAWLIRTAGPMQVINSTIANNDTLHGAISYRAFSTNLPPPEPRDGAVPSIVNSIIAGNLPKNCDGPVMSFGGNLASDGTCSLDGRFDQLVDDAGLGELKYDRGLNPVLGLVPGSPAIGNGRRIYCEPEDGSGLPRFRGRGYGSCDSGSFELQQD